VKEASREFKRNVLDSLKEIGRELKVLGELRRADATVQGEEGTFSYRSLFAIGGSLVGLVGATMVAMSNPVGWVVGGLGLAIGLLSSLFKSKAEKMRNASRKIAEALRDHLENKEREMINEQLQRLSEQVAAARAEVDGHFEGLVSGIARIRDSCAAAELQLSHNRDQLDRRFAARVLDWLAGREISDGVILAVQREPGRRLFIRTADRVSHNRDPEYVRRVLQEELALEP
jgi:hypothetical protein